MQKNNCAIFICWLLKNSEILIYEDGYLTGKLVHFRHKLLNTIIAEDVHSEFVLTIEVFLK